MISKWFRKIYQTFYIRLLNDNLIKLYWIVVEINFLFLENIHLNIWYEIVQKQSFYNDLSHINLKINDGQTSYVILITLFLYLDYIFSRWC